MNIGIYGGTFNPIHYGHIGMAIWTLAHSGLDELWLMVTPGNPLKDGQMLARNEQERLKLARQAVGDAAVEHADELAGKRLSVSDFEFSLPRPSYTAQTLQALQVRYPQHQFSLLIGEDNLRCFKRWREWQWIARNFTVYVYPRRETAIAQEQTLNESGRTEACMKESNEDMQPAVDQFGNLVFFADAPCFDISSTELRARKNR
ncbi:MAG: nicotinate (nicotinamide) nucleotide adenylyltransferase [Paludibacteraceae bacterium]|nr:nicotinate (nicotinamide) nucleotide adenylyltransferase [Paludibacteraceae bacterium]